MIDDEKLLDVVRAAAKNAPLYDGAVLFNEICREVKNRCGAFNAEKIEFQIRHLEEVGALKAEYLDGMLIGVKIL